MSSVNARVPPLRLLAVDNPSDGEVAAYQASSGRFEWVAQSGGGGGGTVTSITLVADAGTGTALTTSGTFTFNGATGISTSVSGTTVTITGPDLTPYVDGSGASSQVAYWSDSDTITGSSNLTFDGSNLSVGGYIKSGGVYDTTGATDLTLKTNGGSSSGQLDLKAGADGNLVFTPNGAGLLQIEGSTNAGAIKLMCEAGTHGITIESAPHSANATYKLVLPDALPSDADNKYLVSDTSGNLSFTSASGGGSPGGSDTQVQFNDGGSFGGESTFTYNKTTNTVTVSNYLTANNTILGYNTGIITTTTTNNIDLKPYYGISGGRIVIPSSDSSNITITPGSSGKVEFNGAYTFPSADGSANQVLQTDGAGSLSFADASGGGSVAGSDTQIQFNDGGAFGASDRFLFDATVSGGSNSGMGIKQNGSAYLSTSFVIYAEGNAYISSQVFGNEFLCSSTSVSDVGFGPQTDQDTGIAFTAADQVDLVVGGNLGLSVDANKAVLVGGSSGTAGQVLTSGGSGAAASWSDASGGSSYNQARNPNGAIYTGQDINILTRGVGMTNVGPLSNSVSTRSNYRQLMLRQFISPETGDVSAFYAYCDTASTDTDIELAIYSDNGGKPYQLLGKGTIDCGSTGAKSQTSLSATISLTEGVQYWYSWVTTNSTGSPTLRAEDQATGQFTTGQTSSISTTDKSMYLIDISAGAENTSPSEITASNLYPGGNTGGACRMGIKF